MQVDRKPSIDARGHSNMKANARAERHSTGSRDLVLRQGVMGSTQIEVFDSGRETEQRSLTEGSDMGGKSNDFREKGHNVLGEGNSGLDISSYNTLIGACATSAISSDIVEQVLRALHLMRQANVPCDAQAYSSLLGQCAQMTGGEQKSL